MNNDTNDNKMAVEEVKQLVVRYDGKFGVDRLCVAETPIRRIMGGDAVHFINSGSYGVVSGIEVGKQYYVTRLFSNSFNIVDNIVGEDVNRLNDVKRSNVVMKGTGSFVMVFGNVT